MFYLLDNIQERGHQGKIMKDEFMKIFEVYELWKYEWSQSSFFDQRTEVSHPKDAHSMKVRIRGIVRSLAYEYVLNAIAIISFMEIAFRDRFY